MACPRRVIETKGRVSRIKRINTVTSQLQLKSDLRKRRVIYRVVEAILDRYSKYASAVTVKLQRRLIVQLLLIKRLLNFVCCH